MEGLKRYVIVILVTVMVFGVTHAFADSKGVSLNGNRNASVLTDRQMALVRHRQAQVLLN